MGKFLKHKGDGVERFLVRVFLEEHSKKLRLATTSDEYLQLLEKTIYELINQYREGKFTVEEIAYIVSNLPDHIEKQGQWLNFGLESFSESIIKGHTSIAFDGGNTLASKARDRIAALQSKQGKE